MNNYKPYPKYKDSGIAWLGEIPEHWIVASCKHILEIPITDGPHTTPELLESGIPFISAESIKNGRIDFNKKRGYISQNDHSLFSKKYSPKRGDIYMVKSGATTGNIAKVETDIQFNIWSPLAVFRADGKLVNPNFLFFTLQSKYFKQGVELHWSFGTQQNIGMGVLSNLPITFGNIHEQTAIARFLDYKLAKINRFIQKKKQLIKLLNEQKAAIINQAVTKGLDPNAKMKDSGIEWLGEIPEHWEVRKLKYVAKVKTGKTPKIESSLVDFFENGTVDWFTPGDFGNEGILNDSNRKINELAINDSQISLFPKKTVFMIGIGGTIGKIGICFDESSCNQQINALIFNNLIEPLYAYYFLKTQKYQIDLLADFTTLPILNQSKTKDIIFVYPKKDEQQQIISYIEKETAIINTTISKIEKELALTEEYKTALIAEAVTGKIDVRGYEVPEITEEETYEDPDSYREEEENIMAAEDAAEYETIEE
jgi:type I restriction enzyme, S subunit